MAFAEPVHDGADDTEFRPQEIDARLVEHGEHFAKEHIDMAAALLDDGIDAERAEQAEEDRDDDEEREEGRGGGDEEVHWASSCVDGTSNVQLSTFNVQVVWHQIGRAHV